MARPPRHLWRIAFSNFINSLNPMASKHKFMGEDTLGNKYYEAIPTDASFRTKPRRWFLPIDGDEASHALQELPSEWEAWLRGRRKVPPSPEEIAENYAVMLLKKENAKKLELERLAAKESTNAGESKLLGASTSPIALKPQEASSLNFPDYGKEYEDVPKGSKIVR